MTFTATLRSRAMSCARYTVAMPPRPSSRRISYSPMVACLSISSASDCASSSWAAGIMAVATLPCSPDTSSPHSMQKRAPAEIGLPQRGQVAPVVEVIGLGSRGTGPI